MFSERGFWKRVNFQINIQTFLTAIRFSFKFPIQIISRKKILKENVNISWHFLGPIGFLFTFPIQMFFWKRILVAIGFPFIFSHSNVVFSKRKIMSKYPGPFLLAIGMNESLFTSTYFCPSVVTNWGTYVTSLSRSYYTRLKTVWQLWRYLLMQRMLRKIFEGEMLLKKQQTNLIQILRKNIFSSLKLLPKVS